MKKNHFFFILFAIPLVGSLWVGIRHIIQDGPASGVGTRTAGMNEDKGPPPGRNLASLRACQKWGTPTKIGSLPEKILPEASDIAISWLNPQMLYHINDSDSGTRFYVSDSTGGSVQNVFVKGVKSQDLEDIAVGPCPYANSCLFLGDVGDNHLDRKFARIIIVREELRYPDTVLPANVIKFTYPNGKTYNVEAVAVHPQTGDIYLATKESYNKLKDVKIEVAAPAKFFRLSRQYWEKNPNSDATLEAEKVGEINMNEITGSNKLRHQIITSMDIAPHGKSFVVMTYGQAYEFYFDLNYGIGKPAQAMVAGVDFQEIQLERLDQQEGVAYVMDPRNSSLGLIYDSESHKEDTPIMFIPCEVPR